MYITNRQSSVSSDVIGNLRAELGTPSEARCITQILLISSINLLPVKFLKYEDLLSETFFVFKEIIEFINKLTNNKSGFSREKAKNAVNTTSFENLKKIEESNGFSESIISREEKKKIPFFHLGPKNNWQKNCPSILSMLFER